MSIQPLPHQISHYNKVLELITKNKFYIDKSKPGSGKTYPPLWIAEKLKLKLFVMGPVTVLSNWKKVSREYDIDIEMCSYQSIRSVKNKQPKHELLTRIDTPDTVIFKPTDKLDKYIKDGYLFVFDECHSLKNTSDQWKACSIITRQILKYNTSKFCLLSGSLFDKPEHTHQLLGLTGFITKPLYYILNDDLEFTNSGIEEILLKSRLINKEKTKEIDFKYNLNIRTINKVINDFLYELFINIIDKTISSSMSSMSTLINYKKNPITELILEFTNIIPDVANMITNYLIEEDKKNGFYYLDTKEDEVEMSKVLTKLQKVTGYNPENNQLNRTFSIKAITKYLRQVELLKINIFVRQAKEILEEDPTCKVVIFLNYIDSIENIADELSDYDPLILYGKTKDKERQIKLFNTKKKHRVIVSNTQVGGTGIELDDKIGNSKRYLLLSPSYNLINMYQASLRVFRNNTRSASWCRFIYVNINNSCCEQKLLNAITKKSDILKQINSNDKCLYPSDYENVFESRNIQ